MSPGGKIRGRDFSSIRSDTPWVMTAPTYVWRVPRILQEWLEETELTGNRTIYFVMTCGENIGSVDRYLEKLTDARGLNYTGYAQIIIPEDHVVMLTTPAQGEAAGIIHGSLRAVDETARQIKDSRPFLQLPITRRDKIGNSMVDILLHSMFVRAKEFQATSACASCGKCVIICLLDNVRLTNGALVWGKNYTHCMACINRYPSQVIEYGKHTQTLPHYICPRSM